MSATVSPTPRLSRSQKKFVIARSRRARIIAEALEPRRLFSTYTVNTLTDPANPAQGLLTLRDAISIADANPGSDTINFLPSLFQSATLQTITLSQGEIDLTDTVGTTTITGPGASLLAISGNFETRIFGIDPNVTAQISGVTITQGFGAMGVDGRYDGGGIYNQGTLTLVESTITGNAANGVIPGSYAFAASRGGGINSSGILTVQSCLFSSNTAYGAGYSESSPSTPSQGFTGAGGAIYGTGPITITNSTLTGNSATGGFAGSQGSGGEGIGGAVYATGALQISNSTLSNNQAVGVHGDVGFGGGGALGGAIFSANSAMLVSSTVSGNTAAGGSSAYGVNGGAYGGGIFATGSLTISSSTVSGNTATSGMNQGPSVATLEADGGGIDSAVNTTSGVGTLSLVQSTVSGNSAVGGDGAQADDAGSTARGAGIFGQTATISASAITGNSATGGNGTDGAASPHVSKAGAGGDASGGGMWLGQPSTITDSTLANNDATSGRGGNAISGTAGGDGGAADGGAIDSTASLQIFDSTISGNTLTGGNAGQGYSGMTPQQSSAAGNPGTAAGGGLLVGADTCFVANSIISANTSATPIAPSSPDDVSGALQITSANNLIGQGGGLVGGVNGNLVPINDPSLGALANNGGPTQTLFPQAGSLAIDAGSNALVPMGLATDQRGLPRVSNGVVDIGAVEVQVAPAPTITLTAPTDQTATVNQSASVSLGSFTESNATGPFTLDIKWNDGSPDTMDALTSAGAIPPIMHVFASSGPITVSESISDAIGTTSNTATFSETVATGALPASMLAFTSPPATVNAGATIKPIDVAVQDATGATVTSDNSVVTLTLNNGATFSDGKSSETAAASLGVAIFNNLSVNAAGAFTLTATDASLTPASASLTILPVASVATSTVTVSAPTIPFDGADTITLQAEDKTAQNIAAGNLSVAFTLVTASGSSAGTIGAVTYAGNGLYTAIFTATGVGTPVQIAATINGAMVTTTRPTITVTPGPLDPATSTISVTPLFPDMAATITLQAKDSGGNNLTTGGAVVVFTLTGAATDTLTATDNGNGTYTANFTPTVPGVIHIGATVNGAAVTSSLSSVVPSLAATIVVPSGFVYRPGRAVGVKLRNVSDSTAVAGPITIQLALSASADGTNPIDVGAPAVIKNIIAARRTVVAHPKLGALPAGLNPGETYYLVAQATAGGQIAGQGVSAPVITAASITAAVHTIRVKPGKTINVPIRLMNSGLSAVTSGTISNFFFSTSADGSNPTPASTMPASLSFAISAAGTGGRTSKKTLHLHLLIPTTLIGNINLLATVSDAASEPLLVAVLTK